MQFFRSEEALKRSEINIEAHLKICARIHPVETHESPAA